MLADIRAYDRCETGRRRGEYSYSPHRWHSPYTTDEERRHRCEAPSELRNAIERPSYYQKPIDVARRLHEQRDNPNGDRGRVPLCRGCFRRALRDGFTPDQWAELNAKAARQPLGKHAKFPKPFKPTQNHPRTEKPEKAYARIEAAIAKAAKDDPRAYSIAGKQCGNDYVIGATDGHTAIIRPGKGKEKTIDLSQTADEWIDLPADFQLAVKRVALLSNDRTSAVTFTVSESPARTIVEPCPAHAPTPDLYCSACNQTIEASEGLLLTLHASSPEYGEATETIPIDGRCYLRADAPPFTCCLNAEYLDLFCGVWPLRWYLRRPETKTRPSYGTSRNTGGEQTVTYTSDQYQTFQPAGCDWRLIVMPMRI